MTPNPLGVALVLATATALITAGFALALLSPVMAGGHLIGGPVLVLAGGALVVRLAVVQSRAGRRADR